VTPNLSLGPHPCNPFALVVGPKLGLRHPELVIHIFNLKLDTRLKDIKDRVLGNVIAQIWASEIQKRSLPHAHILLIFDETSKLRTVEDYDSMVSTEILDPIRHPEMYETIISCMVHGPCGPDFFNAQCME
jgi:hypothetical protein